MSALLRVVMLSLVFAACESGPPRPQEPVWGKQACAHCAMLVSERAPAAQVLLDDGHRLFFDDVGCMVAWQEREAPRLKGQWVRAAGGEGWVEPGATKFSSGASTPMDFGFIAANEGVTFEDVRAAVRTKVRKSP